MLKKRQDELTVIRGELRSLASEMEVKEADWQQRSETARTGRNEILEECRKLGRANATLLERFENYREEKEAEIKELTLSNQERVRDLTAKFHK